jgi:flagellar hook protein FlgE
MFDTLYIGTSGLLNHAKGLRVVSNNLANVNTPGFKGSQLQFSSMFEQQGGLGQQAGGYGNGMTTSATAINFRAGLDQTTGNPLDVKIDGNGFFAVRRGEQTLYTRAGDFRFDSEGILVNAQGDRVLGFDADGKLAEISIATMGRNPPKATTTVKFAGNLTSTVATPVVNATVNGVKIVDASGNERLLNLTFKDNGGGDYTVTVTDPAGTVLTTGTLKFSAGFPLPAFSSISFTYSPVGTTPFAVKLDFSQNVTQLISATTLAMSSQDGYAAGVRSDQAIGADGVITLQYSNGQKTKGPRVAVVNFGTESELRDVGGSMFEAVQKANVQYGHPGSGIFGGLLAGHREGSNVDLAEEFGNLILMQRGYQAASHVVSTTNDMIQQLFDMKGHR